MAYSQSMSSSNPGLIMILLDQSDSMKELYHKKKTRAEVAAMAVNEVINEIVKRCRAGRKIKKRCYVSVIGYQGGGEGKDVRIVSLASNWISDLAGKHRQIDEVTKEIPDANGVSREEKVKMPIWVKPEAGSGTPMAKALEKAYELTNAWVQIPKYSRSFPPIVINITDGEPNDMQIGSRDGSQTKAAAIKLRRVKTTDGDLLLFNFHISSGAGSTLILPADISALHDDYAKFLFNLSSQLPDLLIKKAQAVGLPAQPQARAFSFNADAKTLMKLLSFGTQGVLR